MIGVSEIIANPVNASLENPSVSLRDAAQWEKYFPAGSSEAGVEVNLRSVMGYPPIYRAVTLIAAKCAGTPKQVIETETKQPNRNHPAFRLVGKNQQTSPLYNSLQFVKAMTVQAQLYGNAWAAIFENGRGEPVELVMMDPLSTVKTVVNGRVYWSTLVDGKVVAVADEKVIHIPSTSVDGIEGWAMLDLMRDALGLPIAAQRYSSRFFSNGSNLSGVLMVPGHFSEDKIRNTISAWEKMQTGLTQAHKIALLQDGVKWLPTSADPEKSQLNETRDHELRATVSNITGVPPHLLGDPTRTSHNSLESENTSLLQNCLRPWFDVWEAELNGKLRSQQDKLTNRVTVEFNTRDLLRMEFEKRVNGYAKLKEIGVMTSNDILRSENMPTIGEEGDKRYVPVNWMEIGAEQTPEPQPEAEPMEEDTTADNKSVDVLRAMVESSVSRSLKIERERVVKAAGTAKNFIAWVDKFYGSWTKDDTLGSVDVDTLFTDHAAGSKRQLLDVAGSVTATNLPGAVAECVATWDERGETLTQKVISKVI